MYVTRKYNELVRLFATNYTREIFCLENEVIIKFRELFSNGFDYVNFYS